MNRSAVACFAVLLLAGSMVAPAFGAANVGGTRIGTPEGFTQTVFTIQVHEDGTARWTFEYSRPLANDSEREQFRAFATEFERNESATYQNFVNQSKRLARSGSEATGRNMTAADFSRSASIDDITGARGIVSLSFNWTNFGIVDGDVVRVGDVFEGGLYIGENQRLVFETGPSLAMTSAAPDSYTTSGRSLEESDTITWIGDVQFTDSHPKVAFEPASAVRGDATEDGDTERTARSAGDVLVLVGVLVLVLGLVGAAVWQSDALSRQVGWTGDGSTQPEGYAGEPAPAASEGVPYDELLSDSDRVVKLLEENGGRMKQVNIVAETEWSKSKVSMLLSEMEDDGEISKLRVGRENIISLSGHEPDAAGSPFEDE